MVVNDKQAAGRRLSYFPSPAQETSQLPNEKGTTAGRLSYFPTIDLASLHLSKLPVFEEENETSKRNRCYRAFGSIFPQLFFISIMIIYALLGAALFCVIEGGRNDRSVEFEAFLNKLWTNYESNKTGTEKDRKESFMIITKKLMHDELKQEWLISSKEWSFLESLFFCCTVVTTVGYGHIYPKTRLGKIVCMLYALFGIPLMFLVMATLGDALASIISKIYNNFYKNIHVPHVTISQIRRFSHRGTDPDHVNQTFPHVEVKQSDYNINIQKDSKTTHQKLKEQHQNMELFEKIVGKGQNNTLHVTPQMEWSISCPELEEIKLHHTRHKSLRDIGRIVQRFNVPILVIACVVFAYISFGAAILPFWETRLDFETAFYFCFITFTTIGFGDIRLDQTSVFLFCSIYIVLGMEIVFIAFKLLQDRLFHIYQTVVMFVTKWDIR
ncbi:potassium channel subfamily K member 18 [Notamacropus eugenii]|uniref:potassium channel subfamily K member 18 n=1 Tax=Notamacropus eugenii TaxID=9315 RepID=UPI003B676838